MSSMIIMEYGIFDTLILCQCAIHPGQFSGLKREIAWYFYTEIEPGNVFLCAPVKNLKHTPKVIKDRI